MEMTITGNLVSTPELTALPTGGAVLNFRVAVNHRKRDQAGNWQDDGASFMECRAWRYLAQNIAESMRKGDRIIVHGSIRQSQWQDDQGQTRSSWSLTADSAGPDLSYATARLTKVARRDAVTEAVAEQG